MDFLSLESIMLPRAVECVALKARGREGERGSQK